MLELQFLFPFIFFFKRERVIPNATRPSTTKYHKVFDIFSFFVYFFLIMIAVTLYLEFWILEFEKYIKFT